MSSITAVGFSADCNDGNLDALAEDLAHLVDLGVDAVELPLTHLDLITGGRIVKDRLACLAAVTRRHDVRYTVHGLVSSDFIEPETLPYQLAAAKALVEVCDHIGAGVLVHHAGELAPNRISARAEADKRQSEALNLLAEHGRRHGVRIALENIFSTEEGQYRQTPAEVAATVRAVDHPNLVALIDFSHAYIESTYKGLDFRAEMAAMAPVAGHLHVHDSYGRPIGRYQPFYPQEATALGLGDLHMPLGWGDIDWDDLFGSLDFLPDTTLILEVGSRYRLEQSETLARARELVALNAARALKAAE